MNTAAGATTGTSTWYVRDAQGNPMAVYDNSGGSGAITWKEQDLYGSSRLGMWQPNVSDIVNNTTGSLSAWNTWGSRQYELSNHLGNVLATITDRRVQVADNSTTFHLEADVSSAQTYYAFGGLMPGMQYTPTGGSAYKYGFNGKENDNDVKGTGDQQDYGMRIYDPRIGKFLSVDPLTRSYPWYTPYQFAGNKPIIFIDRDGEEEDPGVAAGTRRKNSEYEGELRRNDPKHAEEIIRKDNINAFLFVGGALTAGSSSIAVGFWDLVMVGGAARTTQGIVNHSKTQATEGVQVMFNAALGEVGGMLIGKTFEIVSPLMRSAGKSLTGTWVKESIEGWSSNAIEYQEFITGVKAGQAFEVNGYRFDGIKNGILLDAKASGYSNFVNKTTGEFQPWFKGAKELLDRARNQLGAAEGNPIEWDFETKGAMEATKKLFEKNNIKGITLKYKTQ